MRPVFLTAIPLALLLAGTARAETAHGTLVDGDGKPVAGALVALCPAKTPGAVMARAGGKTDAEGRFTVAGLPYAASRHHPLNGMASLPGGAWVQFTLITEGERVPLTPRAVPVTLTVKDSHGAAIPGAAIRIRGVGDSNGLRSVWPPEEDANWSARASVKTDRQGKAVLPDLPAGSTFFYRVTHPDFLEIDGEKPLPLSGKTEEPVTLYRGGVLQGRVTWNGRPVAGAKVRALSFSERRVYSSAAVTRTDGTYRLTRVAPGACTVAVAPEGPAKDGFGRTYTGIRLSEGKGLDRLDFQLRPGIPVKVRVVRMEDEKPVSGATLQYMANQFWADQKPVTNEKGEVTLRMAPGSLHVYVESVGSRRVVSILTSEPGTSEVQAIIDGVNHPDLELRLPTLMTLPLVERLSGTVRDAAGKPVPDAELSVLGTDLTTSADTEGRFTFDRPVPPGSLLVATGGGLITNPAVQISGGSAVGLILNETAPSLEGTVVQDDGKPAAGATVFVSGRMGRSFVRYPSTITDTMGKWRMSGLYPGLDGLSVAASSHGYSREHLQGERLATGEHRVLPPIRIAAMDGTVSGRVVDEHGKPWVGAVINAQGRGKDATTDEKGEFQLRDVARGQVPVMVGDGQTAWQFEVVHTGERNRVITLKPRPSDARPGMVIQDRTSRVAPEITAASWLNGGPYNLVNTRGKIVVIDFWAVTCGPCVAALPEVEALAKQYRPRGVVFMGIHSPDITGKALAEFLKKRGITYPNAIDLPDKEGFGATHTRFGPGGIPHLFVISPEGRIVLDANEISDVQKLLEKLLPAPGT